MSIHVVTQVKGQDFKITLSRDEAGNYVAEASRLLPGERTTGTEAPRIRVIDSAKEQALRALYDSLLRLVSNRAGDPPKNGPVPPSAA